MYLDRIAERARRPFWRPFRKSPLLTTFSPWKWFQWISWPPPKKRHKKKQNSSL